jgi:hypothetical protein
LRQLDGWWILRHDLYLVADEKVIVSAMINVMQYEGNDNEHGTSGLVSDATRIWGNRALLVTI